VREAGPRNRTLIRLASQSLLEPEQLVDRAVTVLVRIAGFEPAPQRFISARPPTVVFSSLLFTGTHPFARYLTVIT